MKTVSKAHLERIFFVALVSQLQLSISFASSSVPESVYDQLSQIRKMEIQLEENLIQASKKEKVVQANVKRIHQLIQLQKKERELAKQRVSELEKTVSELEERKQNLQNKIIIHRKDLRMFLKTIERSMVEAETAEKVRSFDLLENEKIEAPKRKFLANLTSKSVKEIEMMKADLSDAERLELQIQEERQQLAYLFQDLNEKESLLELHRQIQADLLKKNHWEKIAQLENYRKLKSSETQVEELIEQFNTRKEIERVNEVEKIANQAMSQRVFTQLKGKLPLPVQGGKILSVFGKAFDPQSKLYVFRKGIEISGGKKIEVGAVSAGKVAFSGELPGYGNVAIIDHGDHYYSLCAHLGQLTKKTGDSVTGGDVIGLTDGQGSPVYFEIRSRNVAVNPLQWLMN